MFSPISDKERITSIHMAVLREHGLINKAILHLYYCQKQLEESCNAFNKNLRFTANCNDNIFDDCMQSLILTLNSYLSLLRRYYCLRTVYKYKGVRALFNNLGIHYKEEYEYE